MRLYFEPINLCGQVHDTLFPHIIRNVRSQNSCNTAEEAQMMEVLGATAEFFAL